MKTKLLTALSLALPTLLCAAEQQKPNILWIITDDHRADALECWNEATTGVRESALGYVSSPNINKLAAEGVLFVNSFCNSPVSAPSRASMHTGKYPHHNGIPAFTLAHNQNDYCNPLVTDIMREAGYKTTLFGKLGTRICDTPDKPSFSTITIYDEKVGMEGDLERVGITDVGRKSLFGKNEVNGSIETWYFPDGTEKMYYQKRKDAERTAEDISMQAEVDKELEIIRDNKNGSILGGVSPMPTEKTLDGRIAEEAMTYLNTPNERYKILAGRTIDGPDSSQPQFINVGFHFPHTAVIPSKEYRDKFKDLDYNVPELTDDEWSKMPAQVRSWYRNGQIEHLSDEQKLQIIRDYYAFCAMGDALLGQVVDEFKAYCQSNNQEYVILFVCGDHGWHLGEQGVCRKGSGYIKSNETAVIAVSSYDKKSFPEGKVVTDFVEYVDFYPTFLELAGVDTQAAEYDYLDGRSLTFTTTGKAEPRDYVIGETSVGGGPRAWIRGEDFAFSMAIREDWRAPSEKCRPNKDIMWGLEAPREKISMALFDLRVDPNEVNNVAYTKEYEQLADWFREKLGNIVLGDGRVEVNWSKKNDFAISTFAEGSDDKRLDIPKKIIPSLSKKSKR